MSKDESFQPGRSTIFAAGSAVAMAAAASRAAAMSFMATNRAQCVAIKCCTSGHQSTAVYSCRHMLFGHHAHLFLNRCSPRKSQPPELGCASCFGLGSLKCLPGRVAAQVHARLRWSVNHTILHKLSPRVCIVGSPLRLRAQLVVWLLPGLPVVACHHASTNLALCCWNQQLQRNIPRWIFDRWEISAVLSS